VDWMVVWSLISACLSEPADPVFLIAGHGLPKLSSLDSNTDAGVF
jgi:hypothetical protein